MPSGNALSSRPVRPPHFTRPARHDVPPKGPFRSSGWIFEPRSLEIARGNALPHVGAALAFVLGMRNAAFALATMVSVLSSFAFGCSGSAEETESLEEDVGDALAANDTFTPAAKRLWDAYVTETTKDVRLQPGCAPLRVPAIDPTTRRVLRRPKGVVVLFHGYTACPQQFMNFDRTVNGRTETVGLAAQLSRAGYEVLLPLLPGHGRAPQPNPAWRGGSAPLPDPAVNKWPVIDDASAVPAPLTSGDQLEGSPYTKLVRQMNAVVAEIPDSANRVVGGISVGGALATHATLLATNKPYTRSLVAAPFYQANQGQLNVIRVAAESLSQSADATTRAAVLDSVNKLSVDPGVFTKLAQTKIWERLGEVPLGWGGECEIAERTTAGRAGICQFQVRHLAGALVYGKLVQDSLAGLARLPTKVQMTGVVDDPVVSNAEVFKVAKRIADVTGASRTSLCVYENASHSMFSWRDSSPSKEWIPPLEASAVAFLTNSAEPARFFARKGPVVDKAGPVEGCKQ